MQEPVSSDYKYFDLSTLILNPLYFLPDIRVNKHHFYHTISKEYQ